MTRPARKPAPAFGDLAEVGKARRRAARVLPVRRLLEWAFGTEHAQLDLPDRRPDDARGFGLSMEAALIERARVGCKIDGGKGPLGPIVHEDAETVAGIVAKLPQHLGGIAVAIRVAQLARAGMAPDAMVGAVPRYEPRLGFTEARCPVTGRLAMLGVTEVCDVVKVRLGGRLRKRQVHWTPIRLEPSPQKIEAARAGYAEWRAALVWLREELARARLREHALAEALPPATPWENA